MTAKCSQNNAACVPNLVSDATITPKSDPYIHKVNLGDRLQMKHVLQTVDGGVLLQMEANCFQMSVGVQFKTDSNFHIFQKVEVVAQF